MKRVRVRPNKTATAVRRRRAAALAAEGLTNGQIAAKLGVSLRCVSYWQQRTDFRRRVEDILREDERAMRAARIRDHLDSRNVLRHLMHHAASELNRLRAARTLYAMTSRSSGEPLQVADPNEEYL